MKKSIKGILVLFALAVVAMSFSLLSSDFTELSIGSQIPKADRKMKNVDGKEMSLSDAQKKNGLLVIFSCNTCPFVVGSSDFPGWEKEYNALYDQVTEGEIGMVLLNSNEAKRKDEDSFKSMKEHAAAKGYKMPYLVDQNSELADVFGARTTPHVFLFDGHGELVYKGSIDNSWDPKRQELDRYLDKALKSLLGGKKIETGDTQPKGCSIKRVAK